MELQTIPRPAPGRRLPRWMPQAAPRTEVPQTQAPRGARLQLMAALPAQQRARPQPARLETLWAQLGAALRAPARLWGQLRVAAPRVPARLVL